MALTVRCAGCGTRTDGVFCPQCGRPLADRHRERRAWLVAGLVAVAAVAVVTLMVRRGAPAPVVPAMGSAAGGTGAVAAQPDLATLAPAERFAWLFDRMMRAGPEGDSATVGRLAPLALAAYGQLDSLDADTRFHAALIDIQIGNFAGARALADTIEARDPGHLFGPIIVGALAKLEGDSAGFTRALARFRQRADGELARGDRPEYTEHATLLNEVRNAAETK